MAAQKVSVTVGDDSIQVSPESLVMSIKDDVRWVGSNSRGFTISFENDGPFGQRHLSHAAALGGMRPNRTGRYKYTVISAEKPSVMLDPEVIVEDPPTGNP